MALKLTDEQLKRVQDIELNILLSFVEIAERHNLKYYLIGGTLLGAIRHGGFIPWDDDLDIAMPREDYDLFIGQYWKELPDSLILQNPETDAAYVMFSKIRLKGTLFEEESVQQCKCNKGVYIDIFPLDGGRKKPDINGFRMKLFNRLRAIYDQKMRDSVKRRYFLVPRKLIHFICELMVKKKTRGMNLICNYYSWIPIYKQTFPSEFFEYGRRELFCGYSFSVPLESEKVLSSLYGDYLQLPPIEKRGLQHQFSRVDLGEEVYE